MAGWRMGFAVGNERVIAALARVKSYLDYGAFTPVQVAATAALNGPEDCIREMRDTYRKRRDALVESFGSSSNQVSLRAISHSHSFTHPSHTIAHPRCHQTPTTDRSPSLNPRTRDPPVLRAAKPRHLSSPSPITSSSKPGAEG
jgi:hypothetical protein